MEVGARPAGPGAGGAAPPFVKRLEELLVGLRRTSKDLAFYPPGHPAMARSVERTLGQLHAVANTSSPLTLSVTRSGFTFEGKPVGAENRQLASMAAEMFVKRMQKIFFAGGVEEEELTAFLRVLSSDPKQLAQQGGPGKALLAQGVRRIQVNEFDFKRLGETVRTPGREPGAGSQAAGGVGGPGAEVGVRGTDPRDAVRGAGEAAGPGWAGPGGRSDAASTTEGAGIGIGAGPAGLPPMGGQGSAVTVDPSAAGGTATSLAAILQSLGAKEEQTVEALLQRLDREAASGEQAGYEVVASRLVEAAGNAARGNRLGELLAILRVFLRHRQGDGPVAPKSLERAALSVDAIATGETLAYLVKHLETPEGGVESDLPSVLLGVGSRAVPVLLDRMASEGDGDVRGRLAVTVARFGESALPAITEAMKKADRDLACDLAMSLGQIGGEGSLALLARLARHEEAPIRAQAVRGLGRVGGPAAHRLLVQALRDSDQAVLELAIGFLGAGRVRQAIPALQRLAEQPSLTGVAFAARKAAVAALGAVGDPASASALAGILHVRTWIRRAAGDELRLAAALALLALATPEAREIVETGSRSSRGDVRRACVAALRQASAAAPATE